MSKETKTTISQIPPPSNTKQPRIDDAQSSTADTDDTDNTEDEAIWFWNESANETEAESEGGGKSDVEELSLDQALPRTEEPVYIQSCPKKISWNQEREDRLRSSYGKGSVSTRRRRKKSAQDLGKEASKPYIIAALWQRNRDLTLVLNAGAPERLVESSDSSTNRLQEVMHLCPFYTKSGSFQQPNTSQPGQQLALKYQQ